ncbi:serine/threonine-protein kinase WNK4-like [Sciurus carolinensis]|uniref:serine/threonine-protein kinase WNK4-like n=1 Tax=Sciurus carolinensis TaxID=30640 RepID=UPI001FB34747|nr:serine/threonine-protein kinase WNK4-like [Sciurus carolinensis]
MGQSMVTPLSLTLDHWQDVRNCASNLSVKVKKKKWVTLCTSEWPTFNVGWPKEGSFNPDLVSQVKSHIFIPGPRGHPDQVPYIVTWEDLVFDPPPWVTPFSTPKPLLSSLPNEPSLPPSAPLIPVPSQTTQTSRLYPILDKSKPSVPPKSKPRTVLRPEENTLIDLLTEEPPPYHPQPLPNPNPHPDSSEEDEEPPTAGTLPDPSPMVGRLRGRKEPTTSGETSKAFPLRQTGGPNGQYQYWPFSASDLYNWKTHNPSFSSDPVALTSLIESILVTHQPTWDDCQQLLQTLLTSEERQKVLLEARKNVPGDNGRPTQLPNLINEAFPLTRPDWDYNTDEGRNHLRLYRQLLIAGLHGAGRRPTNLAQWTQEPNIQC